MLAQTTFKFTYASMFNPPEEFHTHFEEALQQVKSHLGHEHRMIINGKEVFSTQKFEDRSPANTDILLGVFQSGDEKIAQAAVEAASAAFPHWSKMKWQERVALVRKAADIMERRLYEIGVVLALEVGKNRMESIGDAAETIDLFRYACDRMEANDGFVVKMGEDPVPGYHFSNTSIMRPYGVWLVISPFNFPAALTGGPTASALVTGNTVIFKPASDTPWTARLLAECLREAGLPDGVFNYVTGPGSSLGQALIENPGIAGITFTGSYDVGMKIFRGFSASKWVRPTILELGGKNPAIITRSANLEEAALGVTRSAFGLQGQKCSACSRVYIDDAIYDELVGRIVGLAEKLTIGDPVQRPNYMGPVINKPAYESYQHYVKQISRNGRILTGGKILTEGSFNKGYFCAPTLAEIPLDDPLWLQEMFVPITTLTRIKSIEQAMTLANSVDYGLTAGFYGSPQESEAFFEGIETGVAYSNRPQGATTGAWPGFQPFGGWKGSGASGKNAGGIHYLQLYMREQIQTRVTPAGQ